MGRPPSVPVEDKLRIVVSVLSGEMSIAEAVRRNQVSEQSISRWKLQFLDGGRAGLTEGGKCTRGSARERESAAENEQLKIALGVMPREVVQPRDGCGSPDC
jgi:transposase